jgi:hypothetical protein
MQQRILIQGPQQNAERLERLGIRQVDSRDAAGFYRKLFG